MTFFDFQFCLVVFCWSFLLLLLYKYFYTHLVYYLPQEWARPFVNFMGLASSAICFQLFLAVQNSSFCCLILQIGVSYILFLFIILIMNTLVCSANSFTVYCTSLLFSLFPYSANEPEVSHIHRKHLLPLKNEVDTVNFSFSFNNFTT